MSSRTIITRWRQGVENI